VTAEKTQALKPAMFNRDARRSTPPLAPPDSPTDNRSPSYEARYHSGDYARAELKGSARTLATSAGLFLGEGAIWNSR